MKYSFSPLRGEGTKTKHPLSQEWERVRVRVDDSKTYLRNINHPTSQPSPLIEEKKQ
jgi:hypothetical protein